MALLVLLRVGLCVRQNPMCHLCGGNKIELKKCAVGKNKKYRSVGNECRVTRCLIVIWSVCFWSPVKMVYFFSASVRPFVVARSSFTLAANGLRVAAVGDFGALPCQPAQKFDSSTQLQFCTSPPIEATRC
jgi:hypothetical protein